MRKCERDAFNVRQSQRSWTTISKWQDHPGEPDSEKFNFRASKHNRPSVATGDPDFLPCSLLLIAIQLPPLPIRSKRRSSSKFNFGRLLYNQPECRPIPGRGVVSGDQFLPPRAAALDARLPPSLRPDLQARKKIRRRAAPT